MEVSLLIFWRTTQPEEQLYKVHCSFGGSFLKFGKLPLMMSSWLKLESECTLESFYIFICKLTVERLGREMAPQHLSNILCY